MEALLDLLLRLFIILVFGGTSMTVQPPADGAGAEPDNTFRSLTNITEVELLVLETNPPQVHLQIKGEQPDGCDFPVQVEQQRDGNVINVTVYRDVPLDVMCPMMLLTYEDTVPLEGTFPPGTYTFKVNDYVVEREL